MLDLISKVTLLSLNLYLCNMIQRSVMTKVDVCQRCERRVCVRVDTSIKAKTDTARLSTTSASFYLVHIIRNGASLDLHVTT